jgi:hypothetical protein
MRVALYVSRSEFADILGAMRQWLDNHKCPEVRFETATEAGTILLSIELPSVALAEGFRQAFASDRQAAA